MSKLDREKAPENTCRHCKKPIPDRLCFCAACLPLLTRGERLWLMTAQSPADRERLAQNAVTRLRGGALAPRRESVHPKTDAAAAFREARRILAPLTGRKT